MNKGWDKEFGVKKLPTPERFIIKTDDIKLFHLTPNVFKKCYNVTIYFIGVTASNVKLCMGARKS
jgi:hypothetical protein